jgi:hypothetical protein
MCVLFPHFLFLEQIINVCFVSKLIFFYLGSQPYHRSICLWGLGISSLSYMYSREQGSKNMQLEEG